MTGWLRVIWAFLRKGGQEFRFSSFLAQFAGRVISVAAFYYMSRMVSPLRLTRGSGVEMDYFTYVLIGIALTQYLWFGFGAFADRIRGQLTSGTIELFWMSPYPFLPLLFLWGVWDFFMATLHAFAVLAVGVLVFGAPLTWGQVLGILAIGLFAAGSMACLGVVSASWTIAYGRGDFVRPLVTKAMPLISGVFFPVALLPAGLREAAVLFPLTHALTLSRGVASAQHGGGDQAWAALAVITACFGASAWVSIRLSLWKARAEGRLGGVSAWR